ncbi:MAG: hypothetical protein A2020_13785 [Lentisphaerae bacterium GWF2_45_14]|nr:MAG: hypothetical protein A2020_13785 [Lentisphaerae bacterium GWF2_45_14]
MCSELYLIKDKCFEDGDEFSVFKTTLSCSILRKKYSAPELLRVLNNPSAFLSRVSPVLKDSSTTFAGLIRLDGHDFFLKKYNNKGFCHSLRYLFRIPRPLKAFRNSCLFNSCEIPVPEAAAVLCRWKAGLLQDGYLISEFYGDSIPTLDFHKILHNDSTSFIRNEFAATVGSYLARLHENGIAHGDLKMSNIFVRKKDGGSFSYGLWDLDSARIQKRPISEKSRIRELSRVISSFMEIGSRLGVKSNLDECITLFSQPYSDKSGTALPRNALIKRIENFF